MKFPKEIYATIEETTSGEKYANALSELAATVEVGEEKRVAVYELKEIVTIEGKAIIRKKKGR